MEIATKEEHKEQVKELIKFCKKDLGNHCLMYNYMLTIKQIRKEPEDKLMMERLKKQAEEYQEKARKEKARKLKEKSEKVMKETKKFQEKTRKIVKEAKRLFG